MEPEQEGVVNFESPNEFAARVGLHFLKASLLRKALTHRSYINENPDVLEDNERLEFLGDAVLDFLVGAWLYNRFPEMREGELTRLRSALVRTEELATFAHQIDLGQAIRMGRGELQAGGRERKAMLCATFEALVGAIYLDAGLERVDAFLKPMLEIAADQILANRQHEDPKSLLQEIVQAHGYGPPQYRTISATGPEHKKTFEVEALIGGIVYGRGSGHSKRSAAKSAAQDALKRLDLE
jgi:ribonuclease-3